MIHLITILVSDCIYKHKTYRISLVVHIQTSEHYLRNFCTQKVTQTNYTQLRCKCFLDENSKANSKAVKVEDQVAAIEMQETCTAGGFIQADH